MRIALNLAPEDRYVLRSAARLAIHDRRHSDAHDILVNAARTPYEPSLLAVEVSISTLAGRRSRHLRRAREMLASGRYSSRELSELASVMGTLEIEAGSDRRASRLFRQALKTPTDNSVAQAEWAAQRLLSFKVDERSLSIPTSWEARAWAASRAGDAKAAIGEARHWQRDQPFASRPAELGSYEAAKIADFESGIAFAEAGLIANPGTFALRNNLIFCLLSLDRMDEADRHLNGIAPAKLECSQMTTYLATIGLRHYRHGEYRAGQQCYMDSIGATREPAKRALAATMMAREELRAGLPEADAFAAKASELIAKAKAIDLDLWANQMQTPESPGSPRLTSSTANRSASMSSPPTRHSWQGRSLPDPTPD